MTRTYECSSAGDRRFSALYALMPDGRTLEMHYQCDVKGYCPGGRNWRMGKGKPSLRKCDLHVEYTELWRQWACENEQAFMELVEIVRQGHTLTDRFARRGGVSQATSLQQLCEELISQK